MKTTDIILQKGKIYCRKCYSLICLDKESDDYNLNCNCIGRDRMTLQWCDECKNFTRHRGLGDICVKCQMTEHNQSDLMRKVSAETGKKTIKYALDALPEDFIISCKDCKNYEDCEFKDRVEINTFHNNVCMTVLNNNPNIIKANSKRLKEQWKDEEYANKISQNLGEYLGNPDWAREVGVKGRKALAKIFKEDPYFGRKIISKALEYLDNHPEIRQECGRNNIKKAKEAHIQNLMELFSLNLIKLNNKVISFDDLTELKKNDICGSWVIKARFKDYKGTNREDEVFKLGPFKSKTVYDEMDWARRVILQPEKQDRWNVKWVIAKWWYFANLYYNFNLVLLTDENGVTEEEALIAEASYAAENDLFVEFTIDEEGRRIPLVERHAYWSL